MTDFFDVQRYYEALTTSRLGRKCVYLQTVGSTFDVAADEEPDSIVVAREQSKGRGQRDNIWLSPPGCAMASIRLACSPSSYLGQRLCFLQHIVILVEAKTLEELDNRKLGKNQIKIKWPNDILYQDYGSGKTLKIGGILVQTQEKKGVYEICVGFGLNVFNSEPTTCLKDIVGSDENLRIDVLIAKIMNNLEQYTYYLDEAKFYHLKQEYMERCIQINKLVEDEENGRVRVKEVNDDGYLIGERCADQRLCTITKILKVEL